jgi:hypothetical protein
MQSATAYPVAARDKMEDVIWARQHRSHGPTGRSAVSWWGSADIYERTVLLGEKRRDPGGSGRRTTMTFANIRSFLENDIQCENCMIMTPHKIASKKRLN